MLTGLALSGWLVAIIALMLAGASRAAFNRHRCPVDPPKHALLINASGAPESLRTLRNGIAPATYSRQRGRNAAVIYHRIGNAAVYQAKDA